MSDWCRPAERAAITQAGDIYASWFNNDCWDWENLAPAQTLWIGEWVQRDIDREPSFSSLSHARSYARKGQHFHVTRTYPFLRVRRLKDGPAKKLSDWKQLAVGERMLLHPCIDGNSLERAHTRARYLGLRGLSGFRVSVDEDGAAWAHRVDCHATPGSH